MPLSKTSRVYVSHQVYHVCTSHAMMTEREEVMGLLLGDTRASEDGDAAGRTDIFIWASMTLPRVDKRPDRCEIQPEQLVEGLQLAEKIGEEIGQTTRTVGWYHSHPHITCLPSHIDLRTQFQYQQMDGHFVGLIFAVFNADAEAGTMRQELMGFKAVEVAKHGSSELKYEALEVNVVPIHALLPQKSAELARALPKFGGSLGSRDIAAAKELLFTEMRQRHHNEMEELKDPEEAPGENSVARLIASGRYQMQLGGYMSDVIAPLRREMDNAAEKAKLFAELWKQRGDNAKKWGHRPVARPKPTPEAAARHAQPSVISDRQKEIEQRARQQQQLSQAKREGLFEHADEGSEDAEHEAGGFEPGGFVRSGPMPGTPIRDGRRVKRESDSTEGVEEFLRSSEGLAAHEEALQALTEDDRDRSRSRDRAPKALVPLMEDGGMISPGSSDEQSRRSSAGTGSSDIKALFHRARGSSTEANPSRSSTGGRAAPSNTYSRERDMRGWNSAVNKVLNSSDPDSQSFPRQGEVKFIEKHWYEGSPYADKERKTPHPDSKSGRARKRKFLVTEVGEDAASCMSQQYVCGTKYQDVLKENGFEESTDAKGKAVVRKRR
mmetsp:Transcript_37829/g.68945  ORF Transcript_37829/g.68945 Transcript_37829/m.68945 type:complete len:608 (-) Transcript_37829:38-1861(-)